MADAGKRMYGPAAPTTSNTTLITVPSSHTYHVTRIRACNTTATDKWLSLGINGTPVTPANAILFQFVIPANGVYDEPAFIPLVAADTIQGLQETTSALTVTISGVDVT